MDLIKANELEATLAKHEFMVLYIFADWCNTCKEFTPIMENQIVPQIPDIGFVKISATDPDNLELLKKLDFETLPYMAVYHEGEFIGGDSMTTAASLNEFVAMVKLFKMRQTEGAA